MKERVLAVLAAGCLVALAIVARGALSGDDGTESESRSGVRGVEGTPVIACTPDLRELCAALADAGAIAPEPVELDLAQAPGPPPDVDGWITWDPGPQVADFDAGGEVWDDPLVLGTLPLSALTTADTWRVACGADATWDCIRDATDGPFAATIGVGAPSTAEGLARLAPLAAPLLPADDLNDAIAPLRAVVDGPADGQASAFDMALLATTRQGSVDLVVGPEPLLAIHAGSAQGQRRELEVRTPEPAVEATIVLAPRLGLDLGDADAWCDEAAEVIAGFGATACEGTAMGDDLAGFLYQVRRRIG